MKFFKAKFFVVLFSIFISIVLLIIFKPILTAKSLIFPYAIHPFDIVKQYPTIWFYIKIIYTINLFIANFLILNSISNFFGLKNIPEKKPQKVNTISDKSAFSLLIGNKSGTLEKVSIEEKGLYQNILITGTIGSRENKFFNVSYS